MKNNDLGILDSALIPHFLAIFLIFFPAKDRLFLAGLVGFSIVRIVYYRELATPLKSLASAPPQKNPQRE
ncbi:hypothetical protein LZV00_17215 [Pseudomonas kielensis]|uniref:hypothetical protein n=1 Tax=Pseudomonas kielensis TaxID=2762577 RepID=UPI002240E00A|nr:hypothetical protein [Pseudomonas kielensis]UZM12448.1 hypothetical protein LZV00_17215 [Pseudomonas kielensis]